WVEIGGGLRRRCHRRWLAADVRQPGRKRADRELRRLALVLQLRGLAEGGDEVAVGVAVEDQGLTFGVEQRRRARLDWVDRGRERVLLADLLGTERLFAGLVADGASFGFDLEDHREGLLSPLLG